MKVVVKSVYLALRDLRARYVYLELRWYRENMLDHDRSVLYRLSGSESLWEQRVAIVCTITLIAQHQFEDSLALVKKQMQHPHEIGRAHV